MIRQQFPEHIALVKEEAVDTTIMFRHCYINIINILLFMLRH